MNKKNILYLVDENGSIQSVQIAYDFWKKIEKVIQPYLEQKEQAPVQQQGPLNDFKTLMEYWDFKYPYSPKVHCPHCEASTDDWQNDVQHTFILTNANLGGLLVFHCTKCGTTIRHKHFYDHVSIEHTVVQAQ